MVRLKVVPTQSKENCSTYKTPDLFPGSEESQLTLFVVTHNCNNGAKVSHFWANSFPRGSIGTCVFHL